MRHGRYDKTNRVSCSLCQVTTVSLDITGRLSRVRRVPSVQLEKVSQGGSLSRSTNSTLYNINYVLRGRAFLQKHYTRKLRERENLGPEKDQRRLTSQHHNLGLGPFHHGFFANLETLSAFYGRRKKPSASLNGTFINSNEE